MESKQFLTQMKSIPTIDSKEYNQFWEEERKKCEYGITIDGVYITGWLYWHTQLWNIYINKEDPVNKSIKRISSLPSWRDNEWIIAETLDRAEKERKGAMIFGLRRSGKELANYESVITPTGEVQIGNIKVGDVVYGRDGKKTNVVAVHPQGIKPIYRLYFEDGRYIDAGLDHQWLFERVEGRGEKRGRKEIIKTTKDLLNLKLKSACKKGYTYIYYLPQNKPIEFDEQEFAVHPYIFGLLLGDGNMTSISPYIATDDNEIEEYIKEYLGENYEIAYDKNKFIPDFYKYSSVEQRFELLRGLMDSDGSITKYGNIEFAVSSEKLAKDVLWLVRSLGIKAILAHEPKKTVTKKIPRGSIKTFETEKWRVHIRTDLPIFKLKRKLKRIKPRRNTNSVALNRIEYLGEFPATCIEVDNNEHLYVAKDFIVTHNSEAVASYLGHGATLYEGTENVVMGGNWGDIDVVMSKVDHGLKNLPGYFKFGRLANNLRKEVELGFKNKAGERFSWSKIICRNHEEGNNTESPAGLTPSRFILDEVAKSPFLKVLEAAKPSFSSEFGWRCSPLLTGTSGDIRTLYDAQTYFENPEENNFIYAVLEEEGNRKTSIFLPGTYRMEGKVDSTIGNFVKNEKGVYIPDNSILHKVPMQIKDDEKALKVIMEKESLLKIVLIQTLC